MKALILAAGLGTRLKPLTDFKPKALVQVAGKPLLEHTICFLQRYGVKDIVVNIHHFGDQIINFLEENSNFGLNIQISDEREMLLDTGGALYKAAPLLAGDEPILICNVDILTSAPIHDILNYHLKNRPLATLVVRDRLTGRMLKFDDQNILSGWENRSTGESIIVRQGELTSFAFSGMHIVDPSIFSKITERGAFSIISLYLRLAAENKILGYVDRSDYWIDLGKPDSLAAAEEYLRLRSMSITNL